MCSTAAMPCGVIGKSETFTTVPIMVPNSSRLTVLGSNMDLHARLDVLALVGRNVDDGLELHALVLDRDDRRADREHRARRDLDFEHASFDRTDDFGVSPKLARKLVHLPARIVEAELGLLEFAFALRLEIGLLRSQLQDLVLGVFLALLRIGQFEAAILDVLPGGDIPWPAGLRDCSTSVVR